MSRSSFASFHLTGIKPSSGKTMTSSVDRLFENEGEVFISSNYNDFNQMLPSIQEVASAQSKSPEPNASQKTPLQAIDQNIGSTEGDGSSTAVSTAKSSRRDSLTDKVVIPTQHQISAKLYQQQIPVTKGISFEIPKSITSGSKIDR